MKDTVVVGAGLAGLAAAWRLRDRDILVLESGSRTGGRIRSERRGRHVLNWGGHMFAGAGTSTDELLRETGTASVRIPGSPSALSMNGRLLLRGPVPTYPFRIPMSPRARWALLRTGARVSLDVLRYAARSRSRPDETPAERQRRILDFENHRSFADYLGELPEDAEALFRPTVTRSSAEPHQLSAGAGIGYFSLVWNIGQGLDRSILGGASTLTEDLTTGVGTRLLLEAEVHEVTEHHDHVRVRYRHEGRDREVTARTAVLATPAPVTHRIGVDLPAEVREALSRIRYGSYVSAALLTGESAPQRWDRTYAIATPKRSFSVVINSGNIERAIETGQAPQPTAADHPDRAPHPVGPLKPDGPPQPDRVPLQAGGRGPGGSLMAFSPAGLADRLIDEADDSILATYTRDLEQVLPGVGDLIEEAHVQRWRLGAPYCFPGRARIQPALIRPAGRVLLAGDYLGTLYTETAISSGLTAARHAAATAGTAPARSLPAP